MTATSRILIGDVREQLRTLPEKSVQCCVTSPPYWGLRDYGVAGQIGSEATPQEFVAVMVDVFREVRRVLRDDGTLFLNLGDCYTAQRGQRSFGDKAGCKQASNEGSVKTASRDVVGLQPKNLVGIPWRVAIALQEDGWNLRSDCIWQKPNVMPESVTDRPSRDHEYVFLLTKSRRYFFDTVSVAQPATGTAHARGNGVNPKAKTPGVNSRIHQDRDPQHGSARNLRTVWRISAKGFKGAHFATFPPELPERCILAATSERGCCPECGKPWQRQTEKRRVATRPAHVSKTYVDPEGSPYEQHSGSIVGNRDPQRHLTSTVTIGWEPGCKCDAGDPVPCLVLDPFTGSGTTGMVALALGRSFVGVELNPEYAAMAEARIAGGWVRTKPKGKAQRKKHKRERSLFA